MPLSARAPPNNHRSSHLGLHRPGANRTRWQLASYGRGRQGVGQMRRGRDSKACLSRSGTASSSSWRRNLSSCRRCPQPFILWGLQNKQPARRFLGRPRLKFISGAHAVGQPQKTKGPNPWKLEPCASLCRWRGDLSNNRHPEDSGREEKNKNGIFYRGGSHPRFPFPPKGGRVSGTNTGSCRSPPSVPPYRYYPPSVRSCFPIGIFK